MRLPRDYAAAYDTRSLADLIDQEVRRAIALFVQILPLYMFVPSPIIDVRYFEGKGVYYIIQDDESLLFRSDRRGLFHPVCRIVIGTDDLEKIASNDEEAWHNLITTCGAAAMGCITYTFYSNKDFYRMNWYYAVSYEDDPIIYTPEGRRRVEKRLNHDFTKGYACLEISSLLEITSGIFYLLSRESWNNSILKRLITEGIYDQYYIRNIAGKVKENIKIWAAATARSVLNDSIDYHALYSIEDTYTPSLFDFAPILAVHDYFYCRYAERYGYPKERLGEELAIVYLFKKIGHAYDASGEEALNAIDDIVNRVEKSIVFLDACYLISF